MNRLVLALLLFSPIIIQAQNFEWVEEHRVNYSLNPEYPSFPISYSIHDEQVISARIDSFSAVFSTTVLGVTAVESRDTLGALNWQILLGRKCEVQRIEVDQTGDIYVAGKFQQNLLIGSADTLPYINLTPQSFNIFIMRLDPQGTLIWKRNLSAAWPGYESVDALAIDPSKNCWYSFSDFFNAKVVKLDATGFDVTVHNIENCKLVGNISFDNLGGFYCSGAASNGNFVMDADTFNAPFSYNMFLARFSPAGAPSWVHFAHDITFQRPMVVADAYGDAVFAGNRYDSLSFNGSFFPAPYAIGDFFAFKCDTSGTIHWTVKQPPLLMGPYGAFKVGSNLFIDTDALGTVFMSGELNGTVDWGNGYVSSTTSFTDIKSAIVSIDSSGSTQWVKMGGGDFGNYMHGLSASNTGSVYFTGSFRDTAYFDWHIFNTDHFYNDMIGKVRILPVGIDEHPSVAEYSVYPNPANDVLYLSGDINDAVIVIYDLSGRKVYESRYHTKSDIDIRKLRAGSYTLSVEKDEKQTFLRFVKTGN